MTGCLFFHLCMNPDSFEINMHLFMKTEFYPLQDRTSCFNTRTLSKLLGAHESVTHYYFSWIDAKKDGGMALEVSFYSFKYFGTMTETTNLPQDPRWTSENWWSMFCASPGYAAQELGDPSPLLHEEKTHAFWQMQKVTAFCVVLLQRPARGLLEKQRRMLWNFVSCWKMFSYAIAGFQKHIYHIQP